MTDKKLTDIEIIDGFNHCLNTKNCDGCCFNGKICDGSLDGKITTLRLVAEVLNHQKTAIERLQAESERLCIELDETIIAKDLLFDEAEALIKTAKAEAIKEFAERVETELGSLFMVKHPVVRAVLNILVKEKVGEDK